MKAKKAHAISEATKTKADAMSNEMSSGLRANKAICGQINMVQFSTLGLYISNFPRYSDLPTALYMVIDYLT